MYIVAILLSTTYPILTEPDLSAKMSTSEKPRDVSGVELLMNNHQGHKAEIDAREDNFGDVYSLGELSIF